MTTIQFAPNPYAPFSAQVTLDGQLYAMYVLWSLFEQRWYFYLATLQQVPILYRALVGSPADYDINLVEFYFNTPVVFRESTQAFEIGA